MTCNGCGYTLASRGRVTVDHKTGLIKETCDHCDDVPPVWTPDVYLGGSGGREQTDPNLVDPKTLKEIPFSTKREKAAVMRYLNVKQADSAERTHGYRNEEGLHRRKYFI